MSTSEKSPNTVRWGGPGASHENAKKPKEIDKPGADVRQRHSASKVSGGGGETDRHHTHDPRLK